MYLLTLELVLMNQDPLSYPPQIKNGGSPPTHLSSSLDTPLDASYWLQRNWLQHPLCAPEWVIDWALRKDWPFERATLECKQVAGLLPPSPLGGAVLTGGHTCQDSAYQHRKRAVDKLWKDERHCQQAAARQHHLDKEAAPQQQEVTPCQQLLDKQAAQRLHNKRTAHNHQEANPCQ
jgi:hypothetical protein